MDEQGPRLLSGTEMEARLEEAHAEHTKRRLHELRGAGFLAVMVASVVIASEAADGWAVVYLTLAGVLYAAGVAYWTSAEVQLAEESDGPGT